MKTTIPLARLLQGEKFKISTGKKGTVVHNGVGGTMVQWDVKDLDVDIGMAAKQIISPFTEVTKI